MTEQRRNVDDISSGHGKEDIPAQTSDEAAEGMIGQPDAAGLGDAQQAGGTSGNDAAAPGSVVPDAPAPINAAPDVGAKPDVEPIEPKLEDPVSGDPYTGAFAVGTSAETTEQDGDQGDQSVGGGKTDGW